ncbi:hypothetical protein F8M41_015736 [Gigaspora margarita]|uniref:F-box domain-containing protein n=1 Tax=Gigaspora margarita TaxID=4874 RepID=A0A8H4ENB8_GIGMA|nr:hypothetical protein F8M41_015736 [Gigaspora margarita]
MTSKIFTGDMPELMENILNNLNDNISCLHSCALVSRFWSNMSIPILWSDPFSLSRTSSFITRYFSSLNEHDSFVLDKWGIVVDFPNTLFHYARFLKVLDLFELYCKVDEWFYRFNNLRDDINTVTYDLANLLFKLLIESSAALSKVEIYVSDEDVESVFDIKPEIFYSLGRNDYFFSQLQELKIFIKTVPCPQRIITLLKLLGDKAKKINRLNLLGFNEEDPQLFHTVAYVVKSQEQLRSLNLLCSAIIPALRCQHNSLREIILDKCDFSNTNFNELRNYKNLEVIRIYGGIDTDRVLNILDNNLHMINTLELNDYYSINVSNMLQNLQKSGLLLQRLGLYSVQNEISSLPSLLETLISYCPNITYLNLSIIKLSDQFLNLIGYLQKLQFLSLKWIEDESEDESEEEMKSSIMKFAIIFTLF